MAAWGYILRGVNLFKVSENGYIFSKSDFIPTVVYIREMSYVKCPGKYVRAHGEYLVSPSPSLNCGSREVRTVKQFKEDVLAGRVVYEAIYDELAPTYDYDEKIDFYTQVLHHLQTKI